MQNANSSTAPRGFCKIFSRFGFFFQIWDHLLYSAKSDCLQSVTSGTAGLDFVSPPALHKGAPTGSDSNRGHCNALVSPSRPVGAFALCWNRFPRLRCPAPWAVESRPVGAEATRSSASRQNKSSDQSQTPKRGRRYVLTIYYIKCCGKCTARRICRICQIVKICRSFRL